MIRTGFLYDDKLDHARLASALSAVVNFDFPQLSCAIFRNEDNSPEPFILRRLPSSTALKLCTVQDRLTEETEIAEEWRVVGIGKPVLTCSHWSSPHNSLICVTFNHSVMDAHGLWLFMKRWSLRFNSPTVRALPSRAQIQCRPAESAPIDLKAFEREGKRVGLNGVFQRNQVFPLTPCVTLNLLLTRREVDEMKQRLSDGRSLSTNDLIAAYLARIARFDANRRVQTGGKAIGRWDPSDSSIHAQIAVNHRPRAKKDSQLDTDFMGSAVSSYVIDLDYDSLENMAKQVHAAIQSFDGQRVQEAFEWAATQQKYFPQMQSDLPSNSILFTNWSHFDFYQAAMFGQMKPSRFFPIHRKSKLALPWGCICCRYSSEVDSSPLHLSISVPADLEKVLASWKLFDKIESLPWEKVKIKRKSRL